LKQLIYSSLSLCLILSSKVQSDSTETKSDSLKKASKELPLEPERSIALKNPKITWLSLEISPIGKQIYFDALGDLYRMPISGGKAEALT
jgi:hypothetical protein